jgi:hypothetical protein
MARDWVKSVSKAIVEGDSLKVAEVADRALDEISAEVGRLRDQMGLIRQLRALYVHEQAPSAGGMAARSGAPGSGPDGYSSKERGVLVREAAVDLARRGLTPLSVGDVLAELQRKGISFSIARPGSMVGTVLAYMDEFHRKAFNQFEYVGPEGLTVGGSSHGRQQPAREQVE